MNLHDLPLLTLRIRALQDMYASAHASLLGWGSWSLDLRRVYPEEIAAPTIYNQGKRDETEGYGDWQGAPIKLPVAPIAIPAERKHYDERAAVILDERIHSPGVPTFVRHVAKIAYVNHEIPEDQFPRLAGCTEDAFCERLEHLLRFVQRHI
jgi:hypothetical protein